MGIRVRRSFRLVVLACALASAGCQAATEHPGQAAPGHSKAAPVRITTHEVSSSATDPSISGPADANLAMSPPRSSSNRLLLVFLPGSGGRPQCCRLFLDEAAWLGYHAIGLTYDNTVAVGSRCVNNLICYGEVRNNVFDGADPTASSSLAPRDGVEHRLVALLATLARQYPTGGWGPFLVNGIPVYRSIVFAGHSQGGGEAALIGTIRHLRGVISLSSPPDTDTSHVAAAWLSGVPTGATPLDRYFAFVHVGDPFIARIQADWTAMGLGALGRVTSVDRVGPPYGRAHELISSASLPSVILATHDTTAVDEAQPRCHSGQSRYVPVWRYLLQAAGGLGTTASRPGCTTG
jgi:hypothetical protein